MQRSVRKATRRLAGGIDPILTLAFLGLMCIGVLMVYSSSIADAYYYYGSPYYVLQRELVWVAVGFAALTAVARIDYRRWERMSLYIFGAAVLGLLLVLVPHVGHMSHGARRWFALSSSISIEPSEFAKLALVLYMASWLTAKREMIRDFKHGFFPFSLVVGLVALMILREPDLGTALVVSITMFAVFFCAGGSPVHLGWGAAGAAVVAWGVSHHSSYQYQRWTAFLDPWKDASGTGYHTVQALLALGAGGVLGRGIGNSTQKFVLPAPHTDSIVAVIGEELGFVGTAAVLVLFLVIAYRGIKIAMTAPDNYGRLLAAGITSWITFQALMNIAVITSSVPFTGVPLPFVSYGGTSLVITMTAMGILLNISRHTTGEAFARQRADHGRGNGRPSLPRAVNRPVPVTAGPGLPVPRLRRPAQRTEPVRRRPASRGTSPPRLRPGGD